MALYTSPSRGHWVGAHNIAKHSEMHRIALAPPPPLNFFQSQISIVLRLRDLTLHEDYSIFMKKTVR